MLKRLFPIIMSVVLCIGLMPLPAFASESGGTGGLIAQGFSAQEVADLQKPQNVKVTVTDMQQGTMQADGYGQLTGNIATLAVTVDKVPGANQFFVCPLKRTAPGSSYSSFMKVGEGTMPTVNTPPGGKPTFESFDGDVEVGPNGEKITETDTTITVEKKVCILDKDPANNLEDVACYKKTDSAVMEVQALYTDKDNYSNNKQSEEVRIEFPVSQVKKGTTFTENGVEVPKEEVAPPTAKTLTYTGSKQTGVTAGEGYVLSGKTSAKKAGSYVAIAKLEDDYIWADGSQEDKTIAWMIGIASNAAKTAKKGIKKTYQSSKLAQKGKLIKLPQVKTKFGKAKWIVTKKDKSGVLKLSGGKVKVKKGAKAGTYTIKLKAKVPATKNYKGASTKTFIVKVTVK